MSELDVLLPFTTAQALAAGLDAASLRGREYRRLSKGKYVSARRAPSAALDAQAALLGHPPDAFVSHATAARVYRLPVPHDTAEHVSVLDPGERRRRLGVECHVADAGTRVLTFRGVRLADPAHVFIQLAGTLPLVELVVLGDAIARREWYSPEQLAAACARSGEKHAGRALAAARFVRARVDSPMETRLRMLIVLAGLPEPVVNHAVVDEDGQVRRRFDLSYPGLRLIVEYDGRQHAEDARQYEHDVYRREELDRDGWRVVVVTAPGIYARPEETLERIREALRSRGARDLPRRFHRRWRTHFPGRPG